MSSDNYYLIRRDYDHGKAVFVPVMGFASDDTEPEIGYNHNDGPQFSTLNDALDWALNEYSEYGVSVHPECYVKRRRLSRRPR